MMHTLLNLRIKSTLSAALFVALLCLPGGIAWAQSVRGTLAGNILDASGASIPGATITAVSADNGGKNETKSTGAGNYRFPDLPIGVYTVTVSAPGFSNKVSTGVLVQVNGTTALNVTLAAGAVTDTVTVDASGLSLETESSEVSGTINKKQIDELPLSLSKGVSGMRSPETFVFLIPGTGGPGTGTTGNSLNGVFFSRIGGGQAYGAETLLDGASIQRSENGSSFDETSPSIEVLQEFKVTTSTPSAEFGRTTAGIESFSTKSGTNSYHGTAFALIKNAAFDANNWFNNGHIYDSCGGKDTNACAYHRPKDSKFDFGGVFDGPVWIPKLYDGKNKSFFTFAWEAYRFTPSTITLSTLPTAAERTGNFSDILGAPVPGGTNDPRYPYPVQINPCTGNALLYNQIFDPTTSRQITPGVFCRTPYANNTISQPLSQTATKLLAGLPLPNQPPQSTDSYGFINNYSQQSLAPVNNTTYTVRVDQNLGTKSKIFASYSTRQNTSVVGSPNLPGNFNSGSYLQSFTTHYSRVGWDYTITPTLLNHLNLGYNRTNSSNLGASFQSANSLASLGVPNDYSNFYPIINFPSPDQPTSFGQQQNGVNIDNGTRINDSVSWLKGRQSIKVGVDVRIQQYSVINYNTDYLNFYRDQTAAQSFACCNTGAPVASFLLGEVGSGGQFVANVHPQWNSHYWAVFLEDDVKLSQNLTVNVGLRYDVDAPRHEHSNKTSHFNPTLPDAKAGGLPGALEFGTTCNGCNTAWTNTWYKDIAPRLGFAYVLPGTDNKVVIRGGGGLIFGPLQYNDFGGSMTFGYNQSRGFGAVANNAANIGGAFTPAFRLDSSSAADPTNSSIGFPSVSYAPNTDPTQLTQQLGPGDFDAVSGLIIKPQNGRPSMTSNYSLQMQYEPVHNLLFTLGYIGQTAQNLRTGYLTNDNNIDPKYFSLGDRLNNIAYQIPLGGSTLGYKAPYSNFLGQIGQALRPFPQYDYLAGDCCLENVGHSSYHALVTSLERRFSNGFSFQAAYTWAKLMTDADSAIPFSYVNYGNQDHQGQGGSVNLHLDKAVSVQNIPHTFSLNYLYELPFGRGRRFLNKSRALDYLVGGWEVGAIQRYQSGQPISFGCASGIPYFQNCISYTAGPASNGGTDFASAAYKKNKNGPSVFNGQSWFKPAFRGGQTNGLGPNTMAESAFIDQNHEGAATDSWARPYDPTCGNPAANNFCSFRPFNFGNISRVTEAITGPLYLAEDASLLKNFRIYEKLTFQFKVEVIDLFNRHRMALPDTSPLDVGTPLGFGIPGGVDYGPRNMQLSGRIFF